MSDMLVPGLLFCLLLGFAAGVSLATEVLLDESRCIPAEAP